MLMITKILGAGDLTKHKSCKVPVSSEIEGISATRGIRLTKNFVTTFYLIGAFSIFFVEK